MRCFKCNSELSPRRDICIKCGQDVRLYKKLCRASNAYYNVGLNKARIRDLTGAVNALKMSVGLDKTNIDARNLLGLVYFEMGETAFALREWVISNNMLKHDNDAAYFLKVVQGNPNKLDVISGSIRKYNYALKYAQEDGADLAVIQLKKIIATNPKLLRAYQLLALLYIKDKQYKRAESLLKKCLRIDRGNTTARRYLSEIKPVSGKKEARHTPQTVRTAEGEDEEGLDRVIIPVYTKSFGSYFITALDVVIGLALGIGIIYFLVVPAVQTKYSNQYQDELLAYQANVSVDKLTITELEDTIQALEKERDALQQQLSEASEDSTAEPETTENIDSTQEKQYGYILNLLRAYTGDAGVDIVENARNIQIEDTYSEELKQAYEYVQQLYAEQSVELYNTAYSAYEEAETLLAAGDEGALDKYNEAIQYFEACIGLNPSYAQAYAWLGVCEHHMGLVAKAEEYYRYYLENYSDADESLTNIIQIQLDSITGET